ncbi:MAG TPA: DUF655 domain-containing protein [Candidatus Woesearchaeota archaeon]|jgi:putative nucleotide binding protein|nr:DUF655 domain-containing protein [Candidatus Woesearchaeota archaeon]
MEIPSVEHKRIEDREDSAIVLDFLPNGYAFDNTPAHKKIPIAQAIGKKMLTLLELTPKESIFLQPHEEVYIGEMKRDKIHHIVGKLNFEKLTPTAKNELRFVIDEIIESNEKRYLNFFNKAIPLSTRMHSLELLPGMGKKRMWELLEEREDKEFESLQEINKRVKLLPDVKEMIRKRILLELECEQKHYLFVKRN